MNRPPPLCRVLSSFLLLTISLAFNNFAAEKEKAFTTEDREHWAFQKLNDQPFRPFPQGEMQSTLSSTPS